MTRVDPNELRPSQTPGARAAALRRLPAVLPLLTGLVAALALVTGCRPAGPDGDGAGEGRTGNPIVLISVDTLRSDRLPAYGYDGVDTPAIDALRAEAVLFERAYSPIPLTLPAHASLLTGSLPPGIGVRDNAGYRLEEDAGATLGELLGREGYATGAAVSAFPMRSETGLSRGFDHYDDAIPDVERALMANLQRSGDETLRAALGWLDSLQLDSPREAPFFLLFHIYEPHTPREPPEPFASRYDDPYDGEVAAADAVVGRLLEALRERGLYEDSTIVFLSDHGEGLNDHGEEEHGILLYRESLQVPLMIKLPGALHAGATVPYPAQLVDVLPTVLELAGGDVPEGLPGTSLLRLVGEDVAPELRDRTVYSETFHPQLRYGWSGL
ncbi:MAG: sulfatase, partial [Acidobacteriota bacterium]